MAGVPMRGDRTENSRFGALRAFSLESDWCIQIGNQSVHRGVRTSSVVSGELLRDQFSNLCRHPMFLARFLLPIAAVSLMGCACGSRPVNSSVMSSPNPLVTVQKVDLVRYMGDWRVIAIIPYFAEKNAFDSIESYALRPDGKIANWFRFRRGSFDAKQKQYDFTAEVVNKETNAEWRVRFLPFVKVPYLIIDLDADYQWTVVGYPSRRYELNDP